MCSSSLRGAPSPAGLCDVLVAPEGGAIVGPTSPPLLAEKQLETASEWGP